MNNPSPEVQGASAEPTFEQFSVWWASYMPVRSMEKRNFNFVECAYDAWKAAAKQYSNSVSQPLPATSSAKSPYDALAMACEDFRECVLNQRAQFEEGTLDNDQTNAVLNGFDEIVGPFMSVAAPSSEPVEGSSHD